MNAFFNKYLNVIYLSLGVLAIISVISIQLFMLNRTLIVSDEGWYLCLLRDTANYGLSRFQYLFKNIFQGNIFHARLFVWLLTQVTCWILAYGIGSYAYVLYPQKNKWLLYGISIVSVYLGCMYIPSCPSPNYITLNKIAAGLSLGSLMLAISKNWNICYILSGYFASFLFPIMVSNVVIILLIVITILWVSEHKLRNISLYIGGILLFFILYFLCIEPPTSLYKYLKDSAQITVALGSQGHGILFLFQWLLDTLKYLLKMAIMGTIIYGGYICITRWIKNGTIRYVIFGIYVFTVLIVAWRYLPPIYAFRVSHTIVWTKDLYWIMLVIISISSIRNRISLRKEHWTIAALLAITPICLCFGSDVAIYVRQIGYMMFLLPVLFIILGNTSIKLKYMLISVALLNLFIFYSSIFSENWNYDSYLESNIPVSSLGINQNIKLEKRYIDRLKECQDVIPKGEKVLSTVSFWGIVALLDYEPISYEYQIESLNPKEYPKATQILELINQQLNKTGYCWILTNDWDKQLQQSVENLKEYDVIKYRGNCNDCYYKLLMRQ